MPNVKPWNPWQSRHSILPPRQLEYRICTLPRLLLLVVATVGMAQDAPPAKADPLITKLSLEKAQALIQAMGFECKPDKGFFSFRAEGYKVVFLTSEDQTNVQMSVGFTDL